MPKHSPSSTGRLPDDLFDYAGSAQSRRAATLDISPELTVTDNWPEIIPITAAELRVFEAHFGDVLDEIFGPAA